MGERSGNQLIVAENSYIPYGRQCIDEDDIASVVEVLKSDWLTTGPKVEEFEQAFAEFCTAEHAVAVSSGTAALHCAMFAAGVQAGDEVIVTPMTFAASVNCILYMGGTPVFADVDPDSTIAQEEIFGPVLCVIPYEDDDDAVRIANNSIYGLSGGVYSASVERSLAVARRIRTGTLSINGAQWFDVDTPFGGYRQSGVGRENGVQGFEEYLETKVMGVPPTD